MANRNKYSLTTKSHSSTRVNPYDKITLNALNVNCPDKRIILPKLKLVQQEIYLFIIFIVALGTQNLNLYRSVWWLSKTRNSQLINYHLIDLDVSQFSIIFIGQSALICTLRALFKTTTTTSNLSSTSTSTSSSTTTTAAATNRSNKQHEQQQNSSPKLNNNNINQNQNNNNNNNNLHHSHLSSQPHQQQPKPPHSSSSSSSNNIKSLSSTTPSSQSLNNNDDQNNNKLATIVTATASWICNYYLFKCAFRIWDNFGFNGVSFISYPILLSVIMNSTHIIQVFDGCRKTGVLNLFLSPFSMTLFTSHIKLDDDKLCHNCSNQPDEIRDEVEKLRTIFNERLKFVLFKSILLAYYSSVVPLCFAQKILYYDYTWTAQHVVITWFSSLIMLISSSYTPHFYDVLHRSAYHFGKWQKLEARNTLVPCINWSENVIYPQGVVVKHYRGYFRSESVSNCAQPGVSSHFRYYIVFSNPKIGYTVALSMLALLLTSQMYLLFVTTEWYKLISMTNMMLINVISIYRLVKSLVVITKIYKEKQ